MGMTPSFSGRSVTPHPWSTLGVWNEECAPRERIDLVEERRKQLEIRRRGTEGAEGLLTSELRGGEARE
jgi:hypothetical protein